MSGSQMGSSDDLKYSVKDKIQHHVLNWIVIIRYRMVHHGIPKNLTLKSLGSLESLLKKMNLIT